MTSKVTALYPSTSSDIQPVPNAENRLRILMLEDDSADAELQIRALLAAGFRCTCDRVDDERAYTASLETGAYDVVLSDYMLPSFNGLHALRILVERKVDIPF